MSLLSSLTHSCLLICEFHVSIVDAALRMSLTFGVWGNVCKVGSDYELEFLRFWLPFLFFFGTLARFRASEQHRPRSGTHFHQTGMHVRSIALRRRSVGVMSWSHRDLASHWGLNGFAFLPHLIFGVFRIFSSPKYHISNHRVLFVFKMISFDLSNIVRLSNHRIFECSSI